MVDNIRAPQRRRLTDLYMKGELLTINDDMEDGDEPIQVWISKISPLQRKQAGDRANAARAATMAIRHLDEDNVEKLRYYEQLEALGLDSREAMIEFAIQPEVQKLVAAHEAEVAAKDEWSENDYLSALQSAWNESLKDAYALDPENPEALRVYKELVRYTEEVNELVDSDTEALRRDYGDIDPQKLVKDVVDRVIETEADINWVVEFRKWQVFYATRLPENHKMLYFEDKVEIDELDERIFLKLFNKFNEISVDAIEGKD